MNTTKETVDFYSLLKKESGFKVENEGAALNLIQKAFDKMKVDLIKVNEPELVKPKEKLYSYPIVLSELLVYLRPCGSS